MIEVTVYSAGSLGKPGPYKMMISIDSISKISESEIATAVERILRDRNPNNNEDFPMGSEISLIDGHHYLVYETYEILRAMISPKHAGAIDHLESIESK